MLKLLKFTLKSNLKSNGDVLYDLRCAVTVNITVVWISNTDNILGVVASNIPNSANISIMKTCEIVYVYFYIQRYVIM